MKQFWLGAALIAALSGCGSGGGSPFLTTTTPDPTPADPAAPAVPASITGDVTSFSYDPDLGTLTVTGQSLDGTPENLVYNRRPALDQDGYLAFTFQKGSLTRHTTAYVRDIDGIRAALVMSGPQFGQYSGGAHYQRTVPYDRPDLLNNGGLVTYAGSYIGLLNGGDGIGADLLPVNPEPNDPFPVPDPTARPQQAAEITGTVLLNADFADNRVEGLIYNRVAPDLNLVAEDLILETTDIAGNGTFTGEVKTGPDVRGNYAGVFGGPEARAVAGTLYVEDHIANAAEEEEFGIFVLAKCGTPGADPICAQPAP